MMEYLTGTGVFDSTSGVMCRSLSRDILKKYFVGAAHVPFFSENGKVDEVIA